MMSGCQTGVGYPHPDSPIGLTNAFLIAGACTVVSTLWRVSDEPTSDLVIRFYEELKKGKNVAAALRAAQTSMISGGRWTHPLSWGAFKTTGSFRNPLLAKESGKQGGMYEAGMIVWGQGNP
jgi:CHAT domain-containing protein